MAELLLQPERKTLESQRDVSSPGTLYRIHRGVANGAGGTLVVGVQDRTRRVCGLMMAVEVKTEPSFRLAKPKLLFVGRYEGAAGWFGYANYDVSPDGQRFLMIRSDEEPAPTRIHVVLNWGEELKAKVPSDRR